MASAKQELLSQEDQEEEKMKNELIKAGFLETMDKSEMIKIYQIVQESKETSLKNNDISALSSISDCKSTKNISNTSEHTPLGLMSNASDKIATSSTNFVTRSPFENQLNDEGNSSESVFKKSLEINVHKEKVNLDSEEINQDLFSDSDFPPLKENCDINELDSESDSNIDTITINQLTQWRLNPFDFIDNEKSIPLDIREIMCSEFEPPPLVSDFTDPEIYEKLCQKMSEIMDKVHERFILSDDSYVRKSTWGDPIKVATNWNGSLDKNPDEEDCPGPDVSTRDLSDRLSKRKALCNINAATYESNDENNDDELTNTKKRKYQQGKRAEEEAKKNQENLKSKTSFVSSVEMIEVDGTKDFSYSDLNDNSKLCNLQKNSSTKSSINAESNYKNLEYPRRVPPPIPGKKNFKGPKANKKNIIQSKSSCIKKDLLINDEEINKTLHELNEEIDDSDCVDITDEKKNSPVPTHLQNKIQKACSYLETINVAVEQRTKAEEEARRQKEREETIKKDERICKRLQEQEDENSRRIERERILNEKKKEYDLKLKPRVTRSNFIKPYQTEEEIKEDLLLSGNDDEIITIHSNSRSSSCPICQKSFPLDQIESHASECDAFSSEPDDINDQQPCSSRLLNECQICNKYSTYDGNDYAEHVNECMKNMEDQKGIYV